MADESPIRPHSCIECGRRSILLVCDSCYARPPELLDGVGTGYRRNGHPVDRLGRLSRDDARMARPTSRTSDFV